LWVISIPPRYGTNPKLPKSPHYAYLSFQFLQGTVQTVKGVGGSEQKASIFQFLQGTVQTQRNHRLSLYLESYFNSSKVRYKPKHVGIQRAELYNFNSSKVRYKLSFDGAIELGTKHFNSSKVRYKPEKGGD